MCRVPTPETGLLIDIDEAVHRGQTVAATPTVGSGAAGPANPTGLDDLDGDPSTGGEAPPRRRLMADLVDDAHDLMAGNELEGRFDVAGELLVVGPAEPTRLDAEDGVAGAHTGKRQSASLELARSDENQCLGVAGHAATVAQFRALRTGWCGWTCRPSSCSTGAMEFDTFNEPYAQRMLGPVEGGGGLPDFLAIHHMELSPGRLVATMDARDDLQTPFGNLHGGCLTAFVDHCLGVVFYPVIPKGSWVATTEFKVNLLRPVNGGVCTATAEVISLTKRSGVARVDVTNGAALVCAAQGTVTVVAPRP